MSQPENQQDPSRNPRPAFTTEEDLAIYNKAKLESKLPPEEFDRAIGPFFRPAGGGSAVSARDTDAPRAPAASSTAVATPHRKAATAVPETADFRSPDTASPSPSPVSPRRAKAPSAASKASKDASAVPVTGAGNEVDPGEFRLVAVDDIKVAPDRMRRHRDLGPLIENIRSSGLFQPIGVTKGLDLIWGAGRLAAYRELGRTHILARIMPFEGALECKLAEIDENLQREELTVLERSEHLAERKRIYEKLHPETKQGAAPGKAGGGKQAKTSGPGGFVVDTAQKLHRGRSTIAEEVQIGDLPAETREQVRGTDAENNKTQLLQLARLPEEKQKAVVELLQKGEAGSLKDALRIVSLKTDHSGSIFEEVPVLKRGLKSLSAIVESFQGVASVWRDAPDADVDPLVDTIEEIARILAEQQELLEEVMPRETCNECAEPGTSCVRCGRKGWLSQGELDDPGAPGHNVSSSTEAIQPAHAPAAVPVPDPAPTEESTSEPTEVLEEDDFVWLDEELAAGEGSDAG